VLKSLHLPKICVLQFAKNVEQLSYDVAMKAIFDFAMFDDFYIKKNVMLGLKKSFYRESVSVWTGSVVKWR